MIGSPARPGCVSGQRRAIPAGWVAVSLSHSATPLTVLPRGPRTPERKQTRPALTGTAPECANLARVILRYADARARSAACQSRAVQPPREGIEVDTKAGLTIYDDREPLKPSRRPTESQRGN